MGRVGLILLVGWMLAACASGSTGAGDAATTASQQALGNDVVGARLRVVTSFSILNDLVRHVGGDRIESHALVPAGSDAHTFEPSPSDSAQLAEAALVFENGLGFEPWLGDLYSASGSKARRVVVTEGVTVLDVADEHAAEKAGVAPKAEDHDQGEKDPHVWHDVKNAQHMVGVIRDALIAADAANADAYRANADAYLQELQTLDDWVVAQVAQVPEARRKLVTSHDTFGYFAARYGFDIVGTALASASTEAAEPSAGQFAELVAAVKATGAPAIFAENVSNPRLMERLASETGVTLAPPLYTDALSKPDGEADSYVAMMRYNVSTIVEALKA